MTKAHVDCVKSIGLRGLREGITGQTRHAWRGKSGASQESFLVERRLREGLAGDLLRRSGA